jgi:NTP pyrophosphatase (non-canonical NTP hydrolase)
MQPTSGEWTIRLDDKVARVADLKHMVKKFSDERDWDQFHNAKDLAIGIVTEASELLETFRFKSEKEVQSMFEDDSSARKVRDELADVFYFALNLAQRYDIDVSNSLDEKIRDNARRYPVEKAKGSNKKYTELGL